MVSNKNFNNIADNDYFELESSVPFGDSMIWQLNRDYYQQRGIEAWSKDGLPHHLTSNAKIGLIYAEIILGLLKDLAAKNQTNEKVYVLELGAGHGRLAFHILRSLELLISNESIALPSYCYVLSDIAEKNLEFFLGHPQFADYIERGLLDISYYDAVKSDEIYLRKADKVIKEGNLESPLVVVANYFFDSISSDLYFFNDGLLYDCSLSLQMDEEFKDMKASEILEKLKFQFLLHLQNRDYYSNVLNNEILEEYKDILLKAYMMFPHTGMLALERLKRLSIGGMILLSMDKGFHELHEMESAPEPNMSLHGSMSFSVNYHALSRHCEKNKGLALLPDESNFHLVLACLLYVTDYSEFSETKKAYKKYVSDFGPDDINTIKQFYYKHAVGLNIPELISIVRLYAYDSMLFMRLLPRLKFLIGTVSFNERIRINQVMKKVWKEHFNINEEKDISFEMAGINYQLGYYEDALFFFSESENLYGITADGIYNKALCYYQLRQDNLFAEAISQSKSLFPGFSNIDKLEQLDLRAK